IKRYPKNQPEETDCARHYESPPPAVVQSDPGNCERGNYGSHVAPGIKYPGCKCALFLGKPLGDGFDSRGEVSCFAEAKSGASHSKAECRPGQGVGHRSQTPKNQR